MAMAMTYDEAPPHPDGLLAEQVADALYLVDGDGRVAWMNRAAEELFGWTEDEARGRVLHDLVHYRRPNGEPFPKSDCPLMRCGHVMKGHEDVFLAKDGTWIPAVCSHAPLGCDGTVLGAALVIRARQPAAATPRARSEVAMQAKDEFLAMLSHELRNPLAAIRTSLHVARRRPDDARALAIAERQTQHLSRLVDDLFDVASITQGRVQLRLESLTVRALVERAVRATSGLMQARGHRFSVVLPSGDVHFEGDPARLEQVLVNLLDNAAAYTPPGGTIRLLAERAPDEVVLRVQDSGVGIADELLPRVFELFAQADRPLDRTDGGLGIGLTVVKHLVELHRGRVAARSQGAGQGAEFEVRLPLPPQATAEPSGVDEPLAAGTLRVLLVEDNTDTATSLAMLLECVYGHRVTVAHDGFAAVAAARAAVFDVVLLDVGLPGIDGYEVARRLREQPGRPPVVVAVTGYGRQEDRERAAAAGFDHHLVKPVEPDRLEELLTALSRRPD
jgi:PAS domain S-box-containing protein